MRSEPNARAFAGATAYPRWLPWAIALCGFGIDLALTWPGLMSFDSAYAWWQARGGSSTDIIAPAMVRVWQLCERIASGPGPIHALHLALFWSGLALLAGALRRRRFGLLATMLLPAFVPVSMLLRAHVWTDVALAAALIGATGLLAQASASRARGWLAPALALLAYAALLRHNALPAVLPLLAWWAWLLLRGERGASPRATLALVAAVSLCLLGAGRWLAGQVDRQAPVWPSLAQFDLAAISIETGQMQLPAFMIGPGLDVPELALAFRPWSNLPMLTGTRHGMRASFDPPFTPDELAQLRAAWIDAIVRHPSAWLTHRWRVSRALFGTHAADWPVTLIVVDDEYAFRDNPPVAGNGGRLHAALMRAAVAGASTPALAAWPCLLAGLLVLPGAWRRRHEHACGQLPLLLLASAWAYALPLCALAPSAELRYLDWPCLASLLAFSCVAFAPRALLDSFRRPRKGSTPMNTVQRYMFSIDDLPKARGESHELSFQGGSAESFAALLQQALREPSLWQRWKAMQPDPDAVDPGLGANDPAAAVEAHQSDVHVSVEVRSSLPHAVIKHRMTLLIGKHWTLRDVSAV